MLLIMDGRFSWNISFASGATGSVRASMLIRVTEPVLELRWNVRRCSEPPQPCSTIPSKLFLTANPTPCSLGSSEPSPCQNYVYSFSFRVPESAGCVSWRVAMSTFSLLSSLVMTAVFLESLMSCRFAQRPVIIVRTFQHPSFKAGFFW